MEIGETSGMNSSCQMVAVGIGPRARQAGLEPCLPQLLAV